MCALPYGLRGQLRMINENLCPSDRSTCGRAHMGFMTTITHEENRLARPRECMESLQAVVASAPEGFVAYALSVTLPNGDVVVLEDGEPGKVLEMMDTALAMITGDEARHERFEVRLSQH
jgi:hypothetical protein